MEEMRRFFRYLIPGLTFFIETCALLLLSCPDKLLDNIIQCLKFPSASLLVTGLILSGGIGYILSLFQHTFFWFPWISWIYGLDYRPFLIEARGKKLLTCRSPNDRRDSDSTHRLNQAGAWRVHAMILHERGEASFRVKSALPFLDRLHDQMHGAGAAFVGFIFAIIAWLLIYKKLCCNWPSPHFQNLLVYSAVVILLAVHVLSYLQLRSHAFGTVNILLNNELEGHKKAYGILEVYVSLKDLEWIYRVENGSISDSK